MKQAIKLLIIVVFIITIGFLLEKAIDITGIPNYMMNTFEILVELFSVFIAFSIFSITWHAYSESKDNHSLFLGATFLFVGLLILFHMLSYPFMPIFITPNTSHKAAIFLMESRFILAISFLASAYIHKDTLSKFINKRVLLSLIIVLSTISLVFILFYNDVMFAGIDSKEGYSPEIILLLSLVTAIILYACYLYTKRSRETEKNNLIYLIYGSVIVVLSNLVYFSYEFSGHFLIITGFFFIYLALYKSSVILPYEKLAIAEEKLRKGVENKYRNLFDNANDAIITTDLKDCVTSWNHSAEKLFGWEVEKVMGKKLSELFLLSQSASGIGTVYIHETGIRIFVSLTMSQLLDSNQNLTGLSFIIHDITERKKAEDLLIKSKEFNETVINSMNDAISVIDVNNFRIIDANSVFLENYGMKKEEVIGKTCYEITHKSVKLCSPPDDICPLMDTLNTGKHSTAEHVHYMKDGKKRYVEVLTSPIMDENGKVVNVIHVSRDITERKQAEKTIEVSFKRLEEEKAKTESIIAAIGDAISIQDPDFKVLYQNKIHQDIAGDQKGKYCYREYEHRDHVCEDCPVKMSFKDGKIHTEERSIIKNGQKLYFEITSSPLRDSTGNIIAGIEVGRDITERKKAEEQIANSLNEKETLLKEIHHRVKNNMQIISSLLLLQSQNIDDKKYLDIFTESNNRILSMALIHEKLYQSENLAQINIQEYINDLASNLMSSYGGKGNAELEINVENIPLNINYAVPCGLILNELITNSLKYAFPEDRHGKIKIVFQKRDGNMIHFSVSDDGIGIPKDIDIRNTKSLGMHLIYTLAENQLHGEIILNRERGTEFQINFKGE